MTVLKAPLPTSQLRLLALSGMDRLDLPSAHARLAIAKEMVAACEFTGPPHSATGQSWFFSSDQGQFDISLLATPEGMHLFVNPKQELLPFSFNWPEDESGIARLKALPLDADVGRVELARAISIVEDILSFQPVSKAHILQHTEFARVADWIVSMIAALMVEFSPRQGMIKSVAIHPPTPWSPGRLLDGVSGQAVIPQKIATEICSMLPSCVQIDTSGAGYRITAIGGVATVSIPALDPISTMRAIAGIPPHLAKATTLAPRLRKKGGQ